MDRGPRSTIGESTGLLGSAIRAGYIFGAVVAAFISTADHAITTRNILTGYGENWHTNTTPWATVRCQLVSNVGRHSGHFVLLVGQLCLCSARTPEMPSPDRDPSAPEIAAAAARDGGIYDDAGETQPLLGISAPEEDSGEWKAPRHFVLIELAIFSNVFLYGFDGTITAATYAVISSEFDAVNTASWLTTSYLVTSTAFQPLYGRISDIFGRRVCFFICTVTFALGCLGCGVAQDYVLLNLMRALTGFGGGGLMTMGMFSRQAGSPRLRVPAG